MPAETKNIYVKQFSNDLIDQNAEIKIEDGQVKENLEKHMQAPKPNELKGGIRINEYLTYNCLVSDATLSIINEYSGNMKRHWKCPNCSKDYLFDLRERMEHEVDCTMDKRNDDLLDTERAKLAAKKANSSEYFCSVCNQTLQLTSVEILKHKRSHS
jgi:hypothetical protein